MDAVGEADDSRGAWDPYARLIWKTQKYGCVSRRIRYVFSAIYAHLFRGSLMRVKEYFRQKGVDLEFYTIRPVKRDGSVYGELKRF